MAGGVCTVGGCNKKGVATRARQCAVCAQTIFACQGCSANEANLRRPLYCTRCKPAPKKRRHR